MRAVASNQPYRLRFDPSTDAYLLERSDSSGGSLAWYVEGLPRRFGAGGGSFAGVGVAGEKEFSVVFRPTGAVSSATITLKNDRGSTMKVVCSMAGRVRMVKM
jgi:hypothetical protein